MLLFTKRFHAGLVSGAVTITFRRWDRPHVKVGGRYRCHPIGVLEVDRVDRVRFGDIAVEDATPAGFESLAELQTFLRTAREEPLRKTSWLYRVELHHGGDGDRVQLALESELGDDEVAAISAALARMDQNGKWTAKVLALIDANPRVAASQLAKKLRRETLPFKTDVRRLKKLGLTQSFEVGYEISPRGRAYLERRAKKKK
jgi:hypothetical protein